MSDGMKHVTMIEWFRGKGRTKRARAWVAAMSQQEGCIAGAIDGGYAETSAHVSFDAPDHMTYASLPDGCAFGMLGAS